MREELWLHPKCTPLSTDRSGPFLGLGDGGLLTVKQNRAVVSSDDGRNWAVLATMAENGPGVPTSSGVLLRTKAGTIVYVYTDSENIRWSWDSEKHKAGEDVKADVWSIRSLDDGKTWIDRQQIFDGYCGALIDIIETSECKVVVPVQRLLSNPSRHGSCTYVSADEGKSWRRSNIIDLGGHGHHDGAMEPTLEELEDGRLWMLIRTNWDRFWEAYSEDGGLSWRTIKPTNIDASSAPGYLLRLRSGRLVLVWNRLYPDGRSDYSRIGGDCNLTELPVSWHREELSIAFSDDDGRTWTEPVVIARDPETKLSYPYTFERRPGELWVTTRFQGNLRIKLNESHFT